MQRGIYGAFEMEHDPSAMFHERIKEYETLAAGVRLNETTLSLVGKQWIGIFIPTSMQFMLRILPLMQWLQGRLVVA